MELISARTGEDSLTVVKRAVDNVKPPLEVKSRASECDVPGPDGGPVAAQQHAGHPLDRRLRRGAVRETMAECLAAELMDAANGLGAAMKRRDDMQKMAESNKAFAHYRW